VLYERPGRLVERGGGVGVVLDDDGNVGRAMSSRRKRISPR
jgi:hypothetical protein